MEKARIGYIDAMRGFTMILVVYSHVCGFCLGDTTMGFNDVFFLFRLPCFFMISGWLFEQTARRPFREVVRKKFMVQIVPTFIFLLLLAPPPLFFSRLGTTKGGYWFTFTLFMFFLLYLLSVRLGKRWGAWVALLVSFAAFCYSSFYNRLSATGSFSPVLQVLGFLSFATWHYYLFFYLGTVIRRHFDDFLRITGRTFVFLPIVASFLAIAAVPSPANPLWAYLRFAAGGITGMLMVFVLFQWLYTSFAAYCAWRPVVLSSVLKFVGTRTLDIYLLHYFFLPRFLLPYGGQLAGYDSPLLEFVVAMAVALVVVALSLLVSRLLRISPFLAHYLFGANRGKIS